MTKVNHTSGKFRSKFLVDRELFSLEIGLWKIMYLEHDLFVQVSDYQPMKREIPSRGNLLLFRSSLVYRFLK